MGRESDARAVSFENDRVAAMERLVHVVQDLSRVRDLDGLMAVVRTAARELVGADGATFVLRDGGFCHYADEDAIAPLWKGRRFPLATCISGWAMLHRQAVAIEDIYADARIPADAYRPTFVKSLVMVPIRALDPVGAIGTYWARTRRATGDEVRLLQALADSTSVAMESVRLIHELEARVRARTAELAEANRELEAFSIAASHDLRAPLQGIRGYAELIEASPAAGERERGWARAVTDGADRMLRLIEGLLEFSRVGHGSLARERVDVGAVAREVAAGIAAAHRGPPVRFVADEGVFADADPFLLRILLENLLANAWKYSSRRAEPEVSFGEHGGEFFVRDNGAGFDMAAAGGLFTPFHRLHRADEFPGTGVGLATVRRIVERHGGRIRAESRPGAGATFLWTFGDPPETAGAAPPLPSP